ncbi:MAG: hypothetical protein JO322_04505 [Candidatus Eremiobacteraeota bacterium]|nr:hypothetical protein [Candidatus Eremiobacteraeota bacterium]
MKLRRFATVLGLLVLVGSLTTAADSLDLGMTVTPGKLEVAIPLGTTFNVPVSVQNTSFSQSHILASMVDFGVAPNGDYQFEKVGSREFSLLKWAAIRPREFDIPAGTTQQVQLTVSVPSDQKLSGEYAGIIFFQTRPERHGGAVAFSARVASKIYETIPGTVKIDGAITKMTSTKAPGGQSYRIAFKNTGNAHVYLRGMLMVQKGSSVIEQIALPENMLVERDGQRVIDVKGKALEPGSYQAIATVDYGGKTETGGQITFEVR